MLWDTLTIKNNMILVSRNTTVLKTQKMLLYILPFVFAAMGGVILTHVEEIWKYLCIPFFVLILALYKFYYLPFQEQGTELLRIGQGKITYATPDETYIIPIASIREAVDQSVYFDFRGRGNSGWEHKIVLKLKEAYSITKISNTGEESRIYHTESSTNTVEIIYLNLEHEDHNKLFAHLRNVIKK